MLLYLVTLFQTKIVLSSAKIQKKYTERERKEAKKRGKFLAKGRTRQKKFDRFEQYIVKFREKFDSFINKQNDTLCNLQNHLQNHIKDVKCIIKQVS